MRLSLPLAEAVNARLPRRESAWDGREIDVGGVHLVFALDVARPPFFQEQEHVVARDEREMLAQVNGPLANPIVRGLVPVELGVVVFPGIAAATTPGSNGTPATSSSRPCERGWRFK